MATETEYDEPFEASPFHAGELAVQARAGVLEAAASTGRMIRDVLLEQHQHFFAQLSYAFLGVVDERSFPAVVAITGAPGFLRARDEVTLRIALPSAVLQGELAHLTQGDAVALLGIEFATRRRNRLNGRVWARDAASITLRVDQSFGNCPKYIHRRLPPPGASFELPRSTHLAEPWTPQMTALVRAADTVLLATASSVSSSPKDGCDVSHRGGTAGFISVEDTGAQVVLMLPDYQGNRMFNTWGNLSVNPKLGLLVPDFERGSALSISGSAALEWDAAPPLAAGATRRQLRIKVDSAAWTSGALPPGWIVLGE